MVSPNILEDVGLPKAEREERLISTTLLEKGRLGVEELPKKRRGPPHSTKNILKTCRGSGWGTSQKAGGPQSLQKVAYSGRGTSPKKNKRVPNPKENLLKNVKPGGRPHKKREDTHTRPRFSGKSRRLGGGEASYESRGSPTPEINTY